MKKQYLVQSDSTYYSLFAYEVNEIREGIFVMATPFPTPFLQEMDQAKFFGQLARGLVTKGDVEQAPKIELQELSNV